MWYRILGSLIIVAGWNWYHLPHRWWLLLAITVGMWGGVAGMVTLVEFFYRKLINKYGHLSFWKNDFASILDELFFVFSLFFLAYFSRWEWVSLLWFLVVFGLMFWRLEVHLSKHPTATLWKTVNRAMFLFTGFLFLVNTLFQYIAYHFYILDSSVRFFSIVLFRAWSVTSFWLLTFAISGLLFLSLKNRWRFSFLTLWVALLVCMLFIWAVNIAVLRWTGFYFNPLILSHAGGGAGFIWNWLTYLLVAGFVIIATLLFFVLRFVWRAYKLSAPRPWRYYCFSLIIISAFSILAFSSFWTSPEVLMTKSFANYFFGNDNTPQISSVVLQKLERFGLFFKPEQFKVAEKSQVFSESKKLLPDNLSANHPNVLIVFFESFSARLTSMYNPDRAGVTPGLQEMADDPHTTVFNNYYNASSPTITGILSQLCSFLPPTGHEEIERSNQFRRHELLCLPELLRKDAGYKYASYITAVPSTFAHKSTIFESMGVDEVWGQDELAKITTEEPKSWGYSDHQLYPLTWGFIKKSPEPWLIMLSTVDNHPPYDLAKDAVNYGDGKNPVLNSVHTSDDAFKKFWEEFRESEYYKNTIVIAVADHAIFPEAIRNKYFPKSDWPQSFYDRTMFMTYIPDSILPKTVDTRASGLDFTPTILQMFNLNVTSSFEGWSIFGEREKYPNLLGMHEGGLFISEKDANTSTYGHEYAMPDYLVCPNQNDSQTVSSSPLTLCELKEFYNWERAMLKTGRFWKLGY